MVPEAADAARLYQTVQTQWRIGPQGAVGLDYVAIKAGLEMAGRSVTPGQFRGLQIIEDEHLAIRTDERTAKDHS